jgi:hypothetical protein
VCYLNIFIFIICFCLLLQLPDSCFLNFVCAVLLLFCSFFCFRNIVDVSIFPPSSFLKKMKIYQSVCTKKKYEAMAEDRKIKKKYMHPLYGSWLHHFLLTWLFSDRGCHLANFGSSPCIPCPHLRRSSSMLQQRTGSMRSRSTSSHPYRCRFRAFPIHG